MTQLTIIPDQAKVLNIYIKATAEAYGAVVLSCDDKGAEIAPRQEYKNQCPKSHSGRVALLCIGDIASQLIALGYSGAVSFGLTNEYLIPYINEDMDLWEETGLYFKANGDVLPDEDAFRRIGPLKKQLKFTLRRPDRAGSEALFMAQAQRLAREAKPKAPKCRAKFQAASWDAH